MERSLLSHHNGTWVIVPSRCEVGRLVKEQEQTQAKMPIEEGQATMSKAVIHRSRPFSTQLQEPTNKQGHYPGRQVTNTTATTPLPPPLSTPAPIDAADDDDGNNQNTTQHQHQ